MEYHKDRDYAEKFRERDEMLITVDMQKVILLPRLEQYKRCLFTRRVVAINQSFVPIGTQKGEKPRGVLWHEAICGRNDEDVASAFFKVLTLPENRDVRKWTMWLDNCSGQNKCWTLYTMLADVINRKDVYFSSLKLKYFTSGHTFMSADYFHRDVEKEMNDMNNVYDFHDFRRCVARAGNATLMELGDFFDFEKGLSQGKASKESRPLLCNVASVEFRKGSTSLWYKLKHTDAQYQECTFLKRKIVKKIQNGTYYVRAKTELRGIQAEKKTHILKQLGGLMPPNRRQFFQELPVSNAYDMLEEV